MYNRVMSYSLYKDLATEIIKFKSVSTDPGCVPELKKTADWLKKLFLANKFKVDIWTLGDSNPVVFASYELATKNAETVLIYGHYDVQPAEKSDGWSGEPFTLREGKGRLYGRGIVDNKGQFLVHVATVLDLIKRKELKYNVKFILEGNEETGSPNLGKIIETHKKELKSDLIIVSDGEIAGDNPTVEASFRGSFSTTVKYTTAKNNLHSGIYGGAVPNAAYELTKLVSKIYDNKNRVTIPGFYNDVDKITPDQIKNNKILNKNVKETLAITGVKTLLAEPNTDFFTQVGLRPTAQVTGFKSGYIGEGYSNIVPSSAEVRINVRVVTSQDPVKVFEMLKKFVKINTPKYVDYEISIDNPNAGVKVNTSSPRFKKITEMLEEVYKTKPVIKYVGGTLPVLTDFKKSLGVDPMSISLANEDCNMHGVEENYKIDLVKKGLKLSETLLKL